MRIIWFFLSKRNLLFSKYNSNWWLSVVTFWRKKKVSIYAILLKKSFKQWCSTIPSISPKRQISSHNKSWNIKMTTHYMWRWNSDPSNTSINYTIPSTFPMTSPAAVLSMFMLSFFLWWHMVFWVEHNLCKFISFVCTLLQEIRQFIFVGKWALIV
jgi:hypothetical protein